MRYNRGARPGVALLGGLMLPVLLTNPSTTRNIVALRSTTPERATSQHHVIDDSSRGADGVRFADANGDSLLDVVDSDRDLDVITTEEVKNLGVIWHENPTK